jgi:hypothetical protein
MLLDMVSKTKAKTRKKGKQTRGTKKSNSAKKKGAKKTSTRLVRPRKVSTKAQRSSAQRSRVSKPSEQDNKLLTQADTSSLASVDESASYDERQEESQLTPSDATMEEATTDQSYSGMEENIEGSDSGKSEIV